MFHISSDISIKSPLRLAEVATIVAYVLEIPPFVKEAFGRWEGSKALVSKCFGLQFRLCESKQSDGHTAVNEYDLSIDSNVETAHMEQTIDATRYTLSLLSGCPDLEAVPA